MILKFTKPEDMLSLMDSYHLRKWRQTMAGNMCLLDAVIILNNKSAEVVQARRARRAAVHCQTQIAMYRRSMLRLMCGQACGDETLSVDAVRALLSEEGSRAGAVRRPECTLFQASTRIRAQASSSSLVGS